MHSINKRLKSVFTAAALISVMVMGNYSVSHGYGVNTDEVLFTWGAYGETVKSVQDKLKRWGYYSGNIDGVYNYRTMEAVRQYQRKNGIDASGSINISTLELLGIYEQGMKENSGMDSFENDVWLLASLIEKEMKGEDYVTKVSFGAMVLNRIMHPEFPGNLSGVVYESGDFQSVVKGEITDNPSEESLEAARDAMYGWDPVNGAVNYWRTGINSTIPATKISGSYSFGIN